MSSKGQVLCPGCLAPGPRLSGSCSICGAQRHLRGRFWVEAVLESRGATRTLLAREGSAAMGVPGAEGRAVVLRELVLDRDRARAEAPRLAAIEHRLADLEGTSRGLPPYLDHFELLRGGILTHYFVEAAIDGRPLAEGMASGQRIDEAAARALADELLAVLDVLHGHDPQVLHGAIRPAHVIARSGELAEGEPGHVLVGLELLGDAPAPGYTPIEQLMGRATAASDLYALGATLIALLTGKEPAALFDPKTQTLAFEGHLEVSPAFAGVLARMVAPTRSERFASVDEVRRALAGEAVLVTAPAIPTPAAAPAPASIAGVAAAPGLTFGDRVVVAGVVLIGLLAVGAHVGLAFWQHVPLFVGAALGARLLRRPLQAALATSHATSHAASHALAAPADADGRALASVGPPPAVTQGPAPLVEVGRGLAGVVIGESTVADVLATFGADCICHCYDRGSIPGPEVAAAPDRYPRIWEISYDYNERDEYTPSRRGNARRPSSFDIDDKSGRVTCIDIGVYQKALRTREGLSPSSTLADMRALYGDGFEMRSGKELDLYDYPAGIEVWVSRSGATVNSFKIHAPRA